MIANSFPPSQAMLLEKSIDPMAPWDNELPKFVTDARYLG
jgi:transcription elongation regulator 1